MLSIETEARVAKLFLTLAEGEKAVEVSRHVLSEQLSFDPYAAFKRFDSQLKSRVDEFDIVEFLRVNSVYCSYNEARFIIHFYDSDRDGALNYAEFLSLIYSDKNYSLKKMAERLGSTSRTILPFDVEYSLSKLLERELDLVRSLELSLNDVRARYDFNVYDLYSSIQSYSYLTGENVRKFLLRNGVEPSESEVNAIVKRLDTDRDTRVSFTEFKNLFSFPAVDTGLRTTFTNSSLYTSKSSFGRYESPRSRLSPERSSGLSPRARSPVRSPLRTTARSPLRNPIRTTFSPVRVRSPLRVGSPVRLRSPLRTTLRSPVRDFSSTFSKTSFPSYEEEHFLNFLREVISSENDYERNRCDLILRSDFNVEDTFRIFELEGRGYLTDLDLKYGFNALDIFPTSEEISLFMKRFDPYNEGVLSYTNFYSVFNPLNREYSRMLELRLPATYVSRYHRADVFLPTTKLNLQTLFNTILRNEVRIEAWRQKLSKIVRFNTRLIFEKIDRIEKNYASDTDIMNYLSRSDVSFLTKDVELLVARFDRDADGKISYLEFSDELYPKSKEYFTI